MTSYQTVALVFCLCAFAVAQVQSFCPCVYDTHPDGEPGCRVYGEFAGDVIPWYRANETCADALNLTIRPFGHTALWSACPYTNGTGHNVDALVNYVRTNTEPFVMETRLRFPQFFVDDGNNGTKLVDEIVTEQGTFLDCVNRTSFCWSQIKIYFQTQPLQMNPICEDLHYRQKITLSNEQLTVRKLLCENTKAIEGCELSQEQIMHEGKLHGDESCEAYSIPADPSLVPDAELCDLVAPASSSSSVFLRRAPLFVMLVSQLML
jgi:hypothetical protein